MKRNTKLKIAIEAIEIRQRFFVVERNAFKRHGMEFGRKAFENYERLEESKKYLRQLLSNC
jgi:hypothetical protein